MLEKKLDFNDLELLEKREIIAFLEILNANISWASVIEEHMKTIKTIMDLLKIVKPRIWIDKSIEYEQFIEKNKIYEYYFKILYTDYLLNLYPPLTIYMPNLDVYPNRLKKFLEFKYNILKGILNTNHFKYIESSKTEAFLDLSPFSFGLDNLYCKYKKTMLSGSKLIEEIKILCFLLYIGLTFDELKLVCDL